MQRSHATFVACLCGLHINFEDDWKAKVLFNSRKCWLVLMLILKSLLPLLFVFLPVFPVVFGAGEFDARSECTV